MFGPDGPVAFSSRAVTDLADTIIRLLDDPAEREQRRVAGLADAARRTWQRAGEQVEAQLREALRLAPKA